MSKTTIAGIAGAIILGATTILIGSQIPREEVETIDMTTFAFQVEQKGDTVATTTTRTFEYTTLDEDLTLVRREGSVTIDEKTIRGMCMDGVYGSTTILSLTPTEKECDEFIEYILIQNQKWFLEGEIGRLNTLKYK